MIKLSFFNSIKFVRLVFYFALFTLIFLGSITYRHYKHLESINEALQKRYEVSIELEKLISYIKDAETGDRGFTLTNDSVFLDPYLNARTKINRSFNKLDDYTQNNPRQQENLQRIYTLVDRRFAYFKMQFSTTREFKQNLLNGKLTMDSLRNEINSMIDYEKKLLRETDKIYEQNSSNSPLFIFSSFLVSILLIVLGYLRISKNYKKLIEANEVFMIYDESSKQSQILGKYGSWIYNVSTNTFLFSENYYRLFGFEPNDPNMTFENLVALIHPDDKEGVIENFEISKTREHNPPFPFRILKKGTNEVVYLRSKSKMITNKDGEKTLLGTTRDVTEDIEKTNLIEERNRELEKNVKELTEFNHVASHDLQEPLRKIQTFISRIEEKENENLSENGKIYFDRIKNAASRMRILIDDLLQYSRTNRSQQNVYSKVDLNEVIENTIIELAEAINEKNAEIKYDKLPTLEGIQFQITQLFTNLVSNSIKYSIENEVPKIEIKWSTINANDDDIIKNKTNKHYYKISFKDNGIGFEQEYAEQIFNLFQRLHGKKDYPGTGVGLAICKKIVENHKGYIKAISEPNKGSEFIIYLPK